MRGKYLHGLAILGVLALALAAPAGAQTMRIYGALSNFDCYNDSGSETEGFEIELEGLHKEDIVHTWNGSAFGAPTLLDKGTPTAPKAVVRYHSGTAVLPKGGMTHFGVSLATFRQSGQIRYRWLPKATPAKPNPAPVPVTLPTHHSSIVYANGVPMVQDVIHNNAPDGGHSFWVLPYAHLVQRKVELEELMSDNPIVQDAIPMGGGPDGMTPEKLDPGDSWGNDDVAGEGEDESAIYTYEIYEDVVKVVNGVRTHTPGRLLSHVMDATITGSGPIVPSQMVLSDSAVYGTQQVTATVQINGAAPAGGLVLNLTSDDPHVTLPASVVVPPNEFSVTFTMNTIPIASLTPVTITASTQDNTGSISGVLEVKPPDITTLWLAYSANFSGTVFDGAVYLIAPAPAEGIEVALSSSNYDLASVPASVFIPAGETVAHFSVQAGVVESQQTVTIQATLGAITLTQSLQVLPLPKISGTVQLTDCYNLAQTLDFEFRPVGGGAALHRTVTLSNTGAFTLLDVPAGNYRLAIKGSKWLRKVVPVDTSQGQAVTASATLLAGDANNDNSIDIYDLGTLAEAFNTLPGEAGWNPQADFNCDDSVDIFDLGVLAENFNTQGDP